MEKNGKNQTDTNGIPSYEKHTRRTLAVLSIIAVLCLIVGGGIGYKLYNHEISQNARISDLQSQITLLQAEIDKNDVEWGDGFNYLAIGNSITKHTIVDYWWQEDGMAASTADKDYFHLVTDFLKNKQSNVQSYAFNGYAWEVQTNDRSEVLSLWDGMLSEKLDLVTIQLSENVSDLSTFETDFKEMVEYVMGRCPNAQVIVIDDFWDDEKSEIKKSAVDELNADGLNIGWVDLSEIRGNSEYQAGLGTVVYDADGNEHTIEHDGVAKHPGDLGMEYYAEKIEELVD